MNEYLVQWEIEVAAATPREAAERALQIQRDSSSIAVVFDVLDEDGEPHRIDLLQEEEDTERP